MVLLSGSGPNRTPGAVANDGVEPGITVVQRDAAARITSEKSPRQPTRAASHDVDHQMNLTVIGADGALIEQRRQSGGRRLAEP
jgi:hypothetical protein